MRYLKFRVRLTATHPGGHVAWQMRRLTGIAPGGGVFGDPWATSGHSCISERDMTAFDPVSGRVLWQQSLGNGGFISGASSNTAQGLGVLLVGTGQDCVALLGVQVATGRVPWTAKLQASTAQKLGRDGSYQLGIVGSTVAFPKPRGIFVCQLKDGSGGRMRGVNTVYPHSSLLVEPGGDERPPRSERCREPPGSSLRAPAICSCGCASELEHLLMELKSGGRDARILSACFRPGPCSQHAPTIGAVTGGVPKT